MLAEAKLVMTDKLMNMAQVDQAEFPIDDDEDIETVELSDDPEADTAEDADQSKSVSEKDASTEETN